jgi:hypothetical protein
MKVLKNKVIEAVSDETGIRLNIKDINITAVDNNLVIQLWDEDLLNSEYEDESELEEMEYAEEIASQLFEEYYDLRERLIEMKIDHLNSKYLPDLNASLIEKLRQNKVVESVIEVLDFEFIDLNASSTTAVTSDSRDYPVIALRITDFEDIEHNIKIDAYKDPLILDHDFITNELIKKIRGKI